MTEETHNLLSGYQYQMENKCVFGELIRFDFHPTDKTLDTFTMLGTCMTDIELY